MWYQILKRGAGFFFNLLNLLMGGNLPPFGTVCVVVEDKEKRFLIVRSVDGRMTFPGGFMRWHERPEQTVIREGKEETGLELQPVAIIGCYAGVSRHIDRMSTLCIAYTARVTGGQLHTSIEGEPVWLTAAEITHRLPAFYQSVFDEYKLHYNDQQQATEKTQRI